jgi:hypothetical protein
MSVHVPVSSLYCRVVASLQQSVGKLLLLILVVSLSLSLSVCGMGGRQSSSLTLLLPNASANAERNRTARNCLCGLVVRVPGYITEKYCASCEVRTECICYLEESRPPLWSSVRVPGYTTEMYCASCEVRTEFACYVEESRPPLWSSGQSSWLQNGDVLCFL